MAEQAKVLIVYGYHPKETFAVRVGESLLNEFSAASIKVVKYRGKQDKKLSIRHLRRFIGKFSSLTLPIILHSDGSFDVKIDDANANAVIIYYARSKQEKEKILKFLFDFVRKYNKDKVSVIFDTVLAHNVKSSLVEIEFNPKMELENAVILVEDFSRCVSSL